MKSKKAIVLLSLAMIFIGIPVLADRWLAAQYERHDELVKLVECYPFPCAADFNGNGTLDQLGVVQKNPTDRFDWWLTVADGEHELISVPYDGTDGTFRTHAAIYKPAQAEVPHLLIYDGASRQRIKAAFAWDGGKMSEIQPSDLEHEIISAMAARDDTGGWNTWVLWRLTSTFLLPVYCLVVGGVLVLFSVFWVGRRRKLLS
ncbi:MAG TPA: hypothetical protein VM943_04210 [Pyrinomonadaceae bacterium]|nr:hypothetical protein [Pyrinomonadaceae bacterium]